jgi:peroxiredoxin
MAGAEAVYHYAIRRTIYVSAGYHNVHFCSIIEYKGVGQKETILLLHYPLQNLLASSISLLDSVSRFDCRIPVQDNVSETT